MISPVRFFLFLVYSALCFFAYGGWIVQKLDWSHHPHVSDIDTFIDFSCFLFLVAVLLFFQHRSLLHSPYVGLIMFITCFIFGALGQWDATNIAFSVHQKWSDSAIILVLWMSILFALVTAFHLYVLFFNTPTHHRSFIASYIFALAVWISYILVSFFLAKHSDSSEYVFHAHHWLLAYGFSFFACFHRSVVSRLSLGIGMGIFLHGFAAYGRTPLFFSLVTN